MAGTDHTINPASPKLLDDVRKVLRLHHDSLHTERADREWIVRFVRFHAMRLRDDLFPDEPMIEAFLTALAIQGHGAATPHQAMHALVLLYKRVLKQVLKDMDFAMTQLTVRAGKGAKDRCTTFPATLSPFLQHHLVRVKTLPQQDLASGHGAVSLPPALERTYPQRVTAWGWQDVVPARDVAVAPRSGVTRRHPVDPSVSNKAIKVVVRRAGLTKAISAHTFRHSLATHSRQRGTDIRTMQHRLGHTDVATTMIYPPGVQQGGQGLPSPLDDLGG